MKVLSDDAAPVHYNALIYGPPGTGKTSFGVSGPGPVLVLLTERNGLLHIRQAAARLGCEAPEVVFIERFEDMNVVAGQLYADPSKPFVIAGRTMKRPNTVVIDQVSDLGRLLSEEHDKKYPPKDGKDGLPTRARNSWNKFGDRMRGFIKTFRDAPCHTVFIAEYVDAMEGEEENQQRRIGPVLPMKQLTAAMVHAVNVVGITYRTYTDKKDAQGNRIIDYGVNLHGPQYQTTKILRPLNDREVPDFSSWVRRLDGAIENVVLPEPPDEMKEGVAKKQTADGKEEEKEDGVST